MQKAKFTIDDLSEEFYHQVVADNLGLVIILHSYSVFKWWFWYSCAAKLVNYLLGTTFPEWVLASGFVVVLVTGTILAFFLPFYFKNANRLTE